MAFFRDPGEMFLGCLGTVEQKYLVKLIETAAKSGYVRDYVTIEKRKAKEQEQEKEA